MVPLGCCESRPYSRFVPRPSVPFVPKSNAHLLPGDWWAVPLRDKRFAAGRVLAPQAFGPTSRNGVTIALLDWVGVGPPTEQDIAGRPVLAWALSRVESISKTGGEVLGNRPLAADGIEAPVLTHAVGEKSSVWGWKTIVNRAEAQFLDRVWVPFPGGQRPTCR